MPELINVGQRLHEDCVTVSENKRDMCSTGPGGQYAALAYSNTDHFAQHVLIVPYEVCIVDITVVSFLCRDIHGPASLIRELELHLDRCQLHSAGDPKMEPLPLCSETPTLTDKS